MLTSTQSNFLVQQIDNYEVKELLIERAVSNLYLAQDSDAGRPVFLEILHPFINISSNLAAQFQQRMKSVAQLEHPNVAAVFHVGVSATNLVYAAIEHAPGISLAQKVAESTSAETVSVVEALRLVREIAGALAVAHSAGIIHHDLRPENIVVGDDNNPVLIDLGLPFVANIASSPTIAEHSDTLDYTPPEHRRGKKQTAQSNIYSLGIILYELLAGHRPRLTSSRWDIFEKTILAREIALEEARDGLHPETYQLVRKCLRQQEGARYDSMEQMMAAIDTAIAAEQSGVPAKAAAAPTVSLRPRPAAAVGVALLVTLMLLLWVRNGRSSAQINTDPGSAGVNQGIALAAGALAEPTETATATETPSPAPRATPTSSSDIPNVPIELLAPADGSELRGEDGITFEWAYETPLQVEQQFVIYLLAGDREAWLLGPVTEPVHDTHYRLAIDGNERGMRTGDYKLEIILEDVLTGVRLAASEQHTITLLIPTPTALPSPTATATPSATPTATPTPCVVSPWPTWVRYTIRFGDALSPLAVERGTLVEEIRRVNCLEDNDLSVGQVLWLPPLPPTATPTPTNTRPPATATAGVAPLPPGPPPSQTQPPPPPPEPPPPTLPPRP